MFHQLEKSLEEGCIGLSINQGAESWQDLTGQERSRVFEILSKYNGTFSVHLSSYSDTFIHSINEILELAANANVRLALSHMKFLGKKRASNFDYFKKVFNKYSTLIDMRYDIYPFLSICCRLESLVSKALNINDFSKIRLLRTNKTLSRENKQWTEEDIQSLNKIYQDEGNSIVEAFGIEESDMEEFIKDENCFICTDYSSCKIDENTQIHNHPRAFDSIPRSIEILTRLNYPLEDIARMLCVNPVSFYHIKLRGEVKIGYFADMAIINKDLAKGIQVEYTFVNGKMAYSPQSAERVLNGRLILRGMRND